MTRSRGEVTQKSTSRDSVESEAERPGVAEGPVQVEAEPEAAVEAWRIVSDMVLNNARRRKVADTLEHLEAAASQSVMRGVRVRDGNDPVAISPDQQGG